MLLPSQRSNQMTLIESRISYGITCWGGTYLTTLLPLIKLQKHIVKIIKFKTKRSESFPIFKELNCLPLRYLYVYKVLKIFYMRSGTENVNLTNTPYVTRQILTGFVQVPRPHKEIFQKFYSFLAPHIFTFIKN